MKFIKIKFKREEDYKKFELEMLPEIKKDILEEDGEFHNHCKIIETDKVIKIEILSMPND